jgi:aminoglycoside phosphotransferase (APT) family kinase protein
MSTTVTTTARGVDGDRVVAFVEALTGGEVVAYRRMARWRPAWFIDVAVDGGTVPLHVRGDRHSDVLPFPSLEREAGILRALEAGGLPVPHVHGMCPEPEAIVMDAVPGKRDVTGLDAEHRAALGREYVGLLAAMHQLPIAPFVAVGLDEPTTPEQIGLGMLDAYTPLYERLKVSPEPLVEFAIAWARRNVPQHRTRPSFVHWDAGQFLHDGERITALYDFETCLIGDPLMDLAALRLRDPAEPIGGDLNQLFRHYEQVSGEPLDVATLRFHTVVFALVGVMALTRATVEPEAEAPHLEYLWWDLMQRRALVWALAECLGVTVDRPAAPAPEATRATPMLRMLEDSIRQLPPASGYEKYQQRALLTLARCIGRVDAVGRRLDEQDLDEAGRLLGHRPADVAQADRELERFVGTAGPDSDAALVQFFARQVERQVHALEPVADRVAGQDLAPVVLG